MALQDEEFIQHLSKHGSIGAPELNLYLKTKTRHKLNDILTSVNGTLSEHQQQMLRMMLAYLECIEAYKREVEDSVNVEMGKHQVALALLCTIPGVDTTSASAILAEIGTDMSRFPTAEHICSWAGLSPGNNESAGKRKSSAITKGNPYIKSMLCEVAWAVVSHKDMYLSQWYWRIKQKKGSKKAVVALARKILVLIYTMLKSGTLYDESCFAQRRLQCEQKRANRMISELTKLGYSVEAPRVA